MTTEIPVPGFVYALCTGCGDCVAVCPEQALLMDEKKRPRLRVGIDCSYCGLCEETCPTGAIFLSYEIVLGGD